MLHLCGPSQPKQHVYASGKQIHDNYVAKTTKCIYPTLKLILNHFAMAEVASWIVVLIGAAAGFAFFSLCLGMRKVHDTET